MKHFRCYLQTNKLIANSPLLGRLQVGVTIVWIALDNQLDRLQFWWRKLELNLTNQPINPQVFDWVEL